MRKLRNFAWGENLSKTFSSCVFLKQDKGTNCFCHGSYRDQVKGTKAFAKEHQTYHAQAGSEAQKAQHNYPLAVRF